MKHLNSIKFIQTILIQSQIKKQKITFGSRRGGTGRCRRLARAGGRRRRLTAARRGWRRHVGAGGSSEAGIGGRLGGERRRRARGGGQWCKV
jgi:hypothetical protein